LEGQLKPTYDILGFDVAPIGELTAIVMPSYFTSKAYKEALLYSFLSTRFSDPKL
jgi:hypothetical protein